MRPDVIFRDPALRRQAELARCEALVFEEIGTEAADKDVAAWARAETLRAEGDWEAVVAAGRVPKRQVEREAA